MKSKKPLVSFILCVFNGEKYLDQTLSSIKSQTFKNYELIVVNDASKDSSLQIIEYHKRFFKNFTLVKNKVNLGLTKSLNIAAKKANGLWLARIDSDDICHKNRIIEQLSLTKRDHKIAVVGSACDFIDSKNNYLFSRKFEQRNKNILSSLQQVKSFFPHSTALIKKSAFLKVGGYDEFFKFAQDYDLWLRLSEQNDLITSPKSLVFIRLHKDRISNKETKNQQFIFARLAIVSYWLRNVHKIKLNDIQKKLIYRQIENFVAEKIYYRGYFSYQKTKHLITTYQYKKALIYLVKNVNSIISFIFKALSNREYFLRAESLSFVNKIK